MPDPIPRSVPLALAPNDFHFEACIKNAPLTQSRTFTLTMTGEGRMILRRFRLAGSGAGRFTLFGPGEVTLTSGQSATFSVIFDPEKVRTYKARVVFSIIHHRGNGTSRLVWGRVPLEGVGKDCAAEDPNDPPPPEQEDDNEGEGDGPGGGAEGPGGGAPPPGGGATPGTEPPGTFNGPISEVCLRFWKLPGAADDLDAAAFDEWVRQINQIYRNSGVQFRRGAGDVERIDKPLEKSDDHCFDVYVGGTDLIPGDVAGWCEGSRNRTAAGVQQEEGAHEDFRRHGGSIGTSIQMESGHGPNATPPATTLAHELGHALGLGPAVEKPDGSQEHLDPDDGQPITNEERLMHPGSRGTKLTDKERRIAARLARLLKGGPNTSKCHKTTEYRYDPDVRERGAHFEAVEYRNLDESVRFTARTSTGFSITAPHWLSVEISTDDAIGRWSSTINYSAEGEGWRYEAEPGRTEAPPALPAPSFIERIDWPVEAGAPRQAYGVQVDVPKGYFGLSHRTVALRLTAAMAGGPTRSYPPEGYVTLDLTPPAFTIELSAESREATAEPGGILRLKGSGWQSATFTGQVGLTLWLRRHGVSRLIELKPLPRPMPQQWAIEADIPQDLPPGAYRLYLLASCRQCGVDSSASGQLSLSLGRDERQATLSE